MSSVPSEYSGSDSSSDSVVGDSMDDGVSEESQPVHPATLEDILSEWAHALAITSQLREQFHSLRSRCASDREVASELHRGWLENHGRHIAATEGSADGPDPAATSLSTPQADVRAEVAAHYAHILELRAENASLYRAAAEERGLAAAQGHQSAVAVCTYLEDAIKLVGILQRRTDHLEASRNDLRAQLAQSEQRRTHDVRKLLQLHQRDMREVHRLRVRHMHDIQLLGQFQEQHVRDVNQVATLRQDVLGLHHALPPAGSSVESYGSYPASLSAPFGALPAAPILQTVSGRPLFPATYQLDAADQGSIETP
ncbi:uncharacterized protein SCHCODRAFT_02698401 [Schizophyllum commune H4-8]|uniref:uncharacterized protein n=1 Tax=Schizophyllum commune (strain H4-8 / FGSC 9210) TaxID=578458 RepID=UPI00215F5B83|nr:uncharacterized protein SCHCODRAFT_02698401 [Schizophyllum commune H4-8]KAI5897077.1 hypothetical protein SCHCODRAFT_02698401 [Schizophyllum commune H4-8]